MTKRINEGISDAEEEDKPKKTPIHDKADSEFWTSTPMVSLKRKDILWC